MMTSRQIRTPSALDPSAQIFPQLTPAQIERIQRISTLRKVEPGDILFRPGDIGISFFVVLSGSVDIVQPFITGERLITTHQPGGFTGEVNMISGQRCLALGRVREAGELLELSAECLRLLVSSDSELSDIILRAFILRRLALINSNLGNMILMGSRHSADTLRLREFLDRTGQPYMYVDLDADKTSQGLLDRFSIKIEEIPVVICDSKSVLRNPSNQQLADCLGLNAAVESSQVHDVIIVGAGPSGLSAAVYAASEGLNTLLIETEAPGGQAASSSKIENYLGFPIGISGRELTARATNQALKFGAQMMVAHSVAKLSRERWPYQLVLDDGSALSARAIIIATGAQYAKPAIANLWKFEGQGVYYGATHIESQLCGDEEVIVVGGGNSAGQAAVFLSQTAHRVYMLVRSGSLAESMSRYLIQRISTNPRIELHFHTEIVRLDGDTRLERVGWIDKSTGETSWHEIRHVFIMAGASPRTDWLRNCVTLDDQGFIVTGRDLDTFTSTDGNRAWPLARPPLMLETSLPGVFAVGDVRSGNLKRVASAVGEGAISVHLVHRALAEL